MEAQGQPAGGDGMKATLGENLPLFRAARKHDADTSIAAGCKAAKAVRWVADAVFDLMQDGIDRIDEEIWLDLRQLGSRISSGVARHARLVLARNKPPVLIETGERRKTSLGAPSRCWVIASEFRLGDYQGGVR